jgi:hypothetical protein
VRALPVAGATLSVQEEEECLRLAVQVGPCGVGACLRGAAEEVVGFWDGSPCEFCCEPSSGCLLAGRLSPHPQDWALRYGNPRAATRLAEFPGGSLGWQLRLLLREETCPMAAALCGRWRRELPEMWEDWEAEDDEDEGGNPGWMACGGEEYGPAFLRDFESFVVVGAAWAGRRGGGRSERAAKGGRGSWGHGRFAVWLWLPGWSPAPLWLTAVAYCAKLDGSPPHPARST